MKKLLSTILALLMILSAFAALASCDKQKDEPETEAKEPQTTVESGDPETDPETDPATDPETKEPEGDKETEKPAESETEPSLDDVVYENGGNIPSAGVSWGPNAFATVDNVIDEAKAVDITAEELLAILSVRENTLTKDSVYKVSGPLKLSSDTKYYGNFASIIAPDGIIIENASEIVVKELIVKGNLTVTGSSAVTFFKLDLKGDETAITVDETSSEIGFKSCKVYATDTAIKSDADALTVYQSYISAKNGVVSTGDSLSVHGNEIVAKDRAVISSGEYPIIRNNTVTLESGGVGIELTEGSYNALVALNIVKDAQLSIKVCGAFNAVVLLNSAIRVVAENNTNIYVVENKLGGAITIKNNEYLLCDGNTFNKDSFSHPIVDVNNTEVNGDNLHDVNERVQYGANEKLLPHTNKDLFVGMERLNKVKDASLTKSYNINKYIRNCAKNGEVVIVPPGAYVSPSRLALSGSHSNTTIYAYGVYHEAVEYGNTIQFSGVSNITVKGLTIGYAKQSSGQIHVLDKLDGNRLLVIGAAGYDKDFGKSNPEVYSTSYTDMFWAGEYTCWKGIGGSYNVVQKNDDGTMVIEVAYASPAESAKVWSSIGKGDIWCCRMGGSNQQSIYIYNCYDFLMKDCVVYGYAAALAITGASIGGDLKLERVHNTVHSPYVISEEEYNFYKELQETYDVDLEISIDEQGRYRGSIPRVGSVDATHVVQTTGGLDVESCLFESMCDDGSNQRGNSSRLHKLIKNDDGTTTLVYKGTISETYYWLNMQNGATSSAGTQTASFRKGDRIFVYASNGKILCDTTVIDGQTAYSTTPYQMMAVDYTYQGQPTRIVYSCTLYQVTVPSSAIEWVIDEDGYETDQAVALQGYNLADNSYKMDHKVIVDNISLNSAGFTFDNTVVQHTRSRGILVKTRDATVKHCTFRDLAMTGVLLSVETSWGESSVPQNVTIEGCLFDKTSSSFGSESSLKYAPIAIEGLGELSGKVEVTEKTLPCKNIRIIGNKFINNANNYCITMSAAQGITVQNNVFTAREGDTAKRFGRAIYINGCMNINISNNTYSHITGEDVTKAIIANNYKGLKGTDVEGIFPESKDPVTTTGN